MRINWNISFNLIVFSLISAKIGAYFENEILSNVAMVLALIFSAIFIYTRVDSSKVGIRIALTVGLISFTVGFLCIFIQDYIGSFVILGSVLISLISFAVACIIWQYDYYRPYFTWKKSEEKKKN